MAIDKLVSQTDRFSDEIRLREGLAGHIQLPDYTPVLPTDQPASPVLAAIDRDKGYGIDSQTGGGVDPFLRRLDSANVIGKAHVEAYLRSQYRRGFRSGTMSNSLRTITSFLELAKANGKDYLEQIGRSDLEAYIELQQDRGLRASTVNLHLNTLKAFLRHLIEEQIVGSDILFKRMVIKVPQSLPKAIEMPHEKKLLSVIDSVRDRAMILLLLRTGMRIGELLDTRPADIDMHEHKIQIWEAQKNRMGRVVYFTEDAQDALIAWNDVRDDTKEYVFYGSKRPKLTYAAARVMFGKYRDRAGLSNKGYTLHCLRHTNASSLLNAGMPLECLKELLGHQSVEVTRRYARLTSRTREREYFTAMEKIQKGEADGDYRLDRELQKVLEKTQLLTTDGEKLHE